MPTKSDTLVSASIQTVHRKSGATLSKRANAFSQCLTPHSVEAIKSFGDWIRKRPDVKAFTNSDIDNFYKNL